MNKTTQKNEMIKRRFYSYLKDARRLSPGSIGCYERAIWVWEDFSKYADFSRFNQTAAVDFKEWFETRKKIGSEKTLSVSYRYDTLRFLRSFFEWLSKQPGYKHIHTIAVDYLNSSLAETRMASQTKQGIADYPSVEEIKATIEHISGATEVDRRDKALLSLEFLAGLRISALRTLCMKSFDRNKLTLIQDPADGVLTKAKKRIVSVLTPLSYKEPLDYFLSWFDYLQNVRGFKSGDPLFPTTKIQSGLEDHLGFCSTGEVDSVPWKNSAAIRGIFKKRFLQAGIKYYHPHTFRHSLVREMSKLSLTEVQKKAFSQSLGHNNIGMTFNRYGQGTLSEDRVIEVLKGVNFDRSKKPFQLTPEERDFLANLGNKAKDSN